MLTGFLAVTESTSAACTAATEAAPFLEQIVRQAWDPAFNAAHRPAILGLAFVTLSTGCTIIPLPEELTIVIVGFSVYLATGGEVAVLWPAMGVALLACMCANVIGDSIIWGVGKKFGTSASQRWKLTRRLITPARIALAERWFGRYGYWTIFLGRQVPGLRMGTVLVAGASQMGWRRFALIDFLGSLVSVPLWLLVGALSAHPEYGALWAREVAGSISNGLALTAMIVGAALLVIVWLVGQLRSRRERLAADIIFVSQVS